MIYRVGGYVFDEHKRLPRSDFANLRAGLSSAEPRGWADLDGVLPEAYDQNRVGSCVACAMLAGIYGTLAVAGDPLPWDPSVKTTYPECLAVDRALDYPKESARDLVRRGLRDTGTMLMTCAAVVADYGVTAMGPLVIVDGRPVHCDLDPAGIVEPVLGRVEAGRERLIVGAYEMVTQSTLLRDIKLALDHHIPVAHGGWVDSHFGEYRTGSAPIGRQDYSDPLGGGHATLISGYRETPTGTLWRCRNSWDPTLWGQEGRSNFDATDDFVLSRWETVCLSVRRVS